MAPKLKAGESGHGSSGGGGGSSNAKGNNSNSSSSHQSNTGGSNTGHGSSSHHGGGSFSDRNSHHSHHHNHHHHHSSSSNGANTNVHHSNASDRGTPGINERSNDKSEKTGSGGSSGVKRKAESPTIYVDFSTMDITALRRYCRLNKLKSKSRNKDDLVEAATKHWSSIPVKEVDSVAYFLFAVKHRHNVLKLTMPLP